MHMNLPNKLGALGVLVMDAMESALGELSPSAVALLLTLRYRGEMTTTALAGIAGVAQPTAVRVADGLVRRGLLERRGGGGRAGPLRPATAGAEKAGGPPRAALGA